MTIGYTNGNAPDSALKFIDGTHVTPDVYDRVTLLQQYAATVGREVHVIRLGGYANLDEQRARQHGSNAASTIPVAVAGDSTHGNYSPGRVDLGQTVTDYPDPKRSDWLPWLVSVAGMFGLRREFGAADPNHFIADQPITYRPPVPAVVRPETLEIPNMKDILLITDASSKGVWIVNTETHKKAGITPAPGVTTAAIPGLVQRFRTAALGGGTETMFQVEIEAVLQQLANVA